MTKESFSSPDGATRASRGQAVLSPRLGLGNGEQQGTPGHFLGLTPSGYELPPLRG